MSETLNLAEFTAYPFEGGVRLVHGPCQDYVENFGEVQPTLKELLSHARSHTCEHQ